jgi:beta-lactamase regulating signal transducer with metallopeptidase domain
MELLLNLVWVTLALMALSIFVRRRRKSVGTAQVPYTQALLALACTLVLLFPIVSASDDLHPTQAVLEDATKRLHQVVAPLQHAQGNAPAGLLPVLLSLWLLGSLIVVQWRHPEAMVALRIVRECVPRAARAPPSN